MPSSPSASILCNILLDGKESANIAHLSYALAQVGSKLSLNITPPSSSRITVTRAKPAKLELYIHSCNTHSRKPCANQPTLKSGGSPSASSPSQQSNKCATREIESSFRSIQSLTSRLALATGGIPRHSLADSPISTMPTISGISLFHFSNDMAKTTGRVKQKYRRSLQSSMKSSARIPS